MMSTLKFPMICAFFLGIAPTGISMDFSLTNGIVLSNVSTRQPIAKGDWNQLYIPLKRVGNLFLIEAQVDTVKGDFVFDTGAPYLILNKTYFRDLASGSEVSTAGVNSDRSTAIRTSIPRLTLGDLWYEKVDVDIADLRHIENEREFKLLGLMGCNLFSTFHVTIDLNNRQMILSRVDASGAVMGIPDSLISQRIPDLQMSFKFCDEKIFLPVAVNGQKMNWMLDTGAESNVVDASAGKKILKNFIVMRRVQLKGSTGIGQEVLMGIMPEIQVGEINFDMQQTLITGMAELNETCSIYIDGILGYTFLSQGVFTLDFSKKQFCFYLYNHK